MSFRYLFSYTFLRPIFFALFVQSSTHSMEMCNQALYDAMIRCPQEFGIQIDNQPDHERVIIHQDIPLFTTTIHYVEAQEVSYVVEPMNNEPAYKSQDIFTEMAADNARYAWQETVQMDNAQRSELNAHEHQIQNEMIKQERLQLSTVPSVSLNDTLGAVVGTLKSAKKVQILEKMRNVAIQRSDSLLNFRADAHRAQYAFINRFLDGTVLKLLERIQFGNTRESRFAFKQLADLWPFKHQMSFLARECSGAEAQLVELIGADIMKNAEMTLISCPSYLAAYSPRLATEFIASKATYALMQKRGGKETLQQIKENLLKQLGTSKRQNDPLLKSQAVALISLLDDLLTEIYATIAHGTPAQSALALKYIKNQTAEHYAKLNITDPAHISADLIEREGHDTLQTAQFLHETRGDFEKSLAYEKTVPACSAQKLSQPIAHTTKNYALNSTTAEFLIQQKQDPKKFEIFTGNALQQALNQRHVTMLDDAAELHETSNNYAVKQLTEATVQFIGISHEANIHGHLEYAEYMIDYSETTMYIAKEIAIGSAQGARLGINATIERLCHPIDTVFGMAQGAASIGKAIFYMAADISELEVLYETNIELAITREQEIRQKYTPIREALKEQISEMSLRDWSRVAAQVATEGMLQKKFLETTGKLLNNLEKGAVRLIESKTLMAAEECVITADGRVLRTASGPGNQQKNSSGILGNIEKREQILPKVKTYEQARNKALEIIGEVDPHSGNPHYGTVGVGEGKIVGRRWHGKKVIMRLDYDPIKGPHINVTDFRAGKGTAGISVAIPFEGDLQTVERLMKHLGN